MALVYDRSNPTDWRHDEARRDEAHGLGVLCVQLQSEPGAIGQAANFDGIDDQVLFPTFLDTLIADNDISVAFWFNLPTGSILSVLIKREVCNVGAFLDIRMTANRTLQFEVDDGDPAHLTAAFALSSEGWHHVVFTRSGTDLRAYVDGALVDQRMTIVTLEQSVAIEKIAHQCRSQIDGGRRESLRVSTSHCREKNLVE